MVQDRDAGSSPSHTFGTGRRAEGAASAGSQVCPILPAPLQAEGP